MTQRTNLRNYFSSNRTELDPPTDRHPNELRELRRIQPFGASITTKRRIDIRIANQNVHGCDLARPCVKELETMQQHNIDIFGLNETKLSATNSITSRVATAASRMLPNSATILSSSTLQLRQDRPHQPGGTGLLYRGTVNCRSHKRFADPLGRFSYLTIRGRGDCEGILVMTVYRVVKEDHLSRPNGSTSQQHDSLRKMGKMNPNPRKQVLTDVSKVIKTMQQNGYHPLIMGDFNDDISSAEMTRFLRTNGLRDIIADMNDGPPTRTYLHSESRLDFLLGDQHIIDAATKSGSLPLTEGDGPDHAMQFVDLDMKALLQYSPEAPTRLPSRQFTLSNPKKAHEFETKFREQTMHQKLFEQISDLRERLESAGEATPELITVYEKIDQDLTNSFLSCANSVRGSVGTYQRSPALVHAGRMCTLWRNISTCIINGTEWTSGVLNFAELTKFPLDSVTRDKRTAQIETQKAREKYNEAKENDGELRAKWLEEQAEFLKMSTMDNVTKDVESIRKGMIARAKQKQRERRMSRAWKDAHAPLMSTEIPNEIWTYDPGADELYEFDGGLFYVHYRIPTNADARYSRLRTSKKPPSSVLVVEVDISPQHILITTETPNASPSWSEIDNKKDLESWLLTRNKNHLQQVWAEERPPSREPLRSLFGDYGTTDKLMSILENDFDFDSAEFDPLLRTWLEWLAKTDEERRLERISPIISPSQFRSAFKIARERTSSSPSGRHYTLWKALAVQDDMAEHLATMMSLPFMYGFAPKRWTHSIDVMLEKKKGERKIHLMRIIGLLEADFNVALKILFTQQVMPNSEKTNPNPNQWGGRRGRSAVACATRKLVTMEYKRVMKEPFSVFCSDLVSCFDCVIPGMSNAIGMKKGLQRRTVECRGKTLRQMKRAVRTGFGDSTSYYQQEEGDTPLTGETQGKSDIGSIWTLISYGILHVHEMHTPARTCLINIATGQRSARPADAYVDDTDIYADGECPTTALTNEDDEVDALIGDSGDDFARMATSLNKSAQVWNNSVSLTGGALAFHKCSYKLLSFEPRSGRMEIRRPAEMSYDFVLTDHHGQASQIQQTSALHPTRGLGFLFTLDGNQLPEYEYRLEQVSKILHRLSVSPLAADDANHMLRSRVLPSVTYPMSLTSFNKKQCKELTKMIERIVLPKMGINACISRPVLYGPPILGGMNYPNIQTIQDRLGIMNIMKHLRHDSEISTEIRALVSAHQLHSGAISPLLDDPSLNLPHMEDGWIKAIRDSLRRLDGQLWIEDAWTPERQRVGDASLMEAFSRLPSITPGQLNKANHCRLFLKAITLSDITDMTGELIPWEYLTGRARLDSPLIWPRQPQPTDAMWVVFRRLVRLSFCTEHNYHSNAPYKLDSPLGRWRHAPLHSYHSAYRTENRLYEKCRCYITGELSFHCYEHTTPPPPSPSAYDREDFDMNDYEARYTRIEDVSSLPLTAHPTEIEVMDDEAAPLYDYDPPMQPTQQETARPFYLEHNLPAMTSAEILTAVSDGSVNPITGAAGYAWVISAPGREGYMRDAEPIRSDPRKMTSYRAELHGIYKLLHALRKGGYRTSRIELWCDSESAIDLLNDSTDLTPEDLTKAEGDLLTAITRSLRSFPNISLKHVRGHQLRTKRYENLSFEAQLNEDCDAAAKTAMRTAVLTSSRPDPIGGSRAQLYLGNLMISTDYNNAIDHAAHYPALRERMMDKFDWTESDFDNINFDAIETVKLRLPYVKSIQISKMLHNYSNTGSRRQMYGYEGGCPSCDEPLETQLHLYRCTAPAMRDSLTESLQNMEGTLLRKHIPNIVVRNFMHMVREACNLPTRAHDVPCDLCSHACAAQASLGTEAILRGYLVKDWTPAIAKHYRPPPSPANDPSGTNAPHPSHLNTVLVDELWTLWLAIWDTRNDIFLNQNNRVTSAQDARDVERILYFKDNHTTTLRQCDWARVAFPAASLATWRRRTKKDLLRSLEGLHRLYLDELRLASQGQSTLTSWLQFGSNPT